MKAEEDYIFFHQPIKNKYSSLLSSLQTTQNITLENKISKNKFNYTNMFPKEIKTQTITKSSNRKKILRNNINNNSVKLPLLINKNIISSYEKRKRYKIIIPEKKGNMTYLPKKRNDNDDEIDIKQIKKNRYKNYYLKKSEKRKKELNELLDEINKTEDRFNKEIPNVDSDLISKDKIIVDNKWKNSFYLDEYQQFFMKHLKDKISGMNFRQMMKKFRDISIMCFSPGNEHNIPKKINYI